MAGKPSLDKVVRNFLRDIGRKGGLARAKRHSKEELSNWGRLGGRPSRKAKRKKGVEQ